MQALNNNNFKNRKEISNQATDTLGQKVNLLDGDLVSLINGLIESLKEYYKVSRSNNSDANKIFLFYQEEEQNLKILLNEIVNNNQYQKINELFDKINILNKIIAQLQDNSNSCLQNLNLFFEDAKLIFKNIRDQRQKQLSEKNALNKNISSKNSTDNMIPPNLIPQVNKYYTQLLVTVNKLADFNYLIEGADADSVDYYNNLQNTIKKDLGELIKYILKYAEINNEKSLSSLRIEESSRMRSKSSNNSLNKELEKLKIINQQKEKKIRELTGIIQKMKKSNLYLNTEENNSQYNIRHMNTESSQRSTINKLENIIQEKDNQLKSLINKMKTGKTTTEPNNNNIKKILAEKNNQIFNLQKQLNIYEQNENNFNKQVDELNNRFQKKIQQYENQILMLKNNSGNNINNKNHQSRNNMNYNKQMNPISKSEFNINVQSQDGNRHLVNEYQSKIKALNNKNINLMKILKKQKNNIDVLNKEIVNYKNKIAQFDQLNKIQIEEMNNNIYKNNKIIEQKDELIKQLREKKEIPNSQININMSNQPNNNEIILLKFENEKLKNEIASLKSSRKGNINNLLTNNISPSLYGNNNQDSQKLNINLMNENKTLKTKITQLEENIKLLTSKNEEQKNTIKNLEIQLDKKQEEIAGLHDFIVKLQSKLENEDFIIQKSNVGKTSKSQMDIKNQTDQNIAEKMKNYLDLLNKANNDISALQKKNKELQFKLEEKQLEEDLSGFRTEEVNFSNYEEEFDLKKMVNGARDKNRSEDINIDYPGMQGVKEKYKDLQQNMNMLEEQVKILISNINCNNNKIKPQISQICQIMRIPAKNIPLIIAGKNKKKSLGLID